MAAEKPGSPKRFKSSDLAKWLGGNSPEQRAAARLKELARKQTLGTLSFAEEQELARLSGAREEMLSGFDRSRAAVRKRAEALRIQEAVRRKMERIAEKQISWFRQSNLSIEDAVRELGVLNSKAGKNVLDRQTIFSLRRFLEIETEALLKSLRSALASGNRDEIARIRSEIAKLPNGEEMVKRHFKD